jgi:hypothetical protein
MKPLVWFVMDRACELTGHRMWACYNTAPRAINRLWFWSWDL